MTSSTLTAAAAPAAQAQNPDAMVRAVGVTKVYDTGHVEVNALRGIDLSIRRGEMVAIMGPSGCGKTTLLNCLSGLDSISGGDVSDRRHVTQDDVGPAAHPLPGAAHGFRVPVLQPARGAHAPPRTSRCPCCSPVSPPRKRASRALEALDLVGLRARSDQRPAELSGGERQRVTIARALVNNPAIVWADEPTGDLDSTNAQEIINLMCRLNQEQDVTFALVTHDIAIGRRAHRIVRMKDGVIVDEVIPA